MQITVSAPGKIHLLGEHTVVYGHPALLAAVDKRIYISVKREALSVKEKKIILFIILLIAFILIR